MRSLVRAVADRTQRRNTDEDYALDHNLDIETHWIAWHACLKNEFTRMR